MAGKELLIKSLKELLENEDVEAIQEKVAELKEHYESLFSVATPEKADEKENAEEKAETAEKSEVAEAVVVKDQEAEKSADDEASEPKAEETPTVEGTTEASVEAESEDAPPVAVDEEKKESLEEEKQETPKEETAIEAKDENVNTAIESAELQDEDDKAFKLLLDEFNKRRNDLKKLRAEEVKKNLEAARSVIAELKQLNAEEENISRSFNRLKELQVNWKAIGNVPKDQYRDLQHEYSQELDIFFYNINIYKELRENDLKKNTGLKEALISDVEALAGEENIKILDQKLKEFQEQWHQIGPTFKEEWEALRDKFWNSIRDGYGRINEHYDKRRAEHDTNLKAKQELVEKIAAETIADIKDHKAWKAATDIVIEAQGAWRKIGFATKKENDRIWKDFRTKCDEFFEKKQKFYDAFKEEQEVFKKVKQDLIQQAEGLKESKEWRDTTEKFKDLQRKWKDAGSGFHRDEQILWKKFRGACDHFFESKKKHFASKDEENAENLVKKEALLKKMESHKASGKKLEDLASIKTFQDEWRSIGHVPMKLKEKVNSAYFKFVDDMFGALDLDEAEKAKARFQSKIEGLASSGDAVRIIQKEQNFIRGKKQQLQDELNTLEGNISMFFRHAKETDPMFMEVNKKVDKLKREMQKLVDQEKMLRQHAKKVE